MTTSMPTNNTRIQWLVVLFATSGQLGIDLYLPSMPNMAAYFHVASHAIQLSLSFYLLGYSIAQLIFGPLSDKYGRKPPLLIGVSITLLAGIAIIFSHSIAFLLSFRLLQGIGAAACAVIGRAIMRDVFEGRSLIKAQSLVLSAWSLTPILAPILGGYLEHYFAWQANFIFIVGFNGLVLLAILLLLTETHPPQAAAHGAKTTGSQARLWQNYRRVLSHKVFWGYCLATSLVYASLIAYNIATPFLYQVVLGFSPVAYGWLLFITACMIIVGAKLNARWISHYASKSILYGTLIALSIFGSFILLLALLAPLHLLAVLLPFSLCAVCIGIILPNSNAGILLPFSKNLSGTAGAVKGSVQMLLATVVSSLIAYSHAHSALSLGLAITLLGLLSLLFFRRFSYDQTNY